MRAVRQFLWNQRLPLIAVALAAVNSLLFWSLGPRVPLGLFMTAVLVSAWQGGLHSAVLATALSVLMLAGISHYQSPGPEDDLLLRLGLFALVGLIAGYLSQQCRQAIRAVEHVHEVLGSSGIGLISADSQGRVTALNPLARSLTGRAEADAHGQPLSQVFHVVDGTTRQPLLFPLGTTQELTEGTLLIGPHGGEMAIEGTVSPVRDADGRPTGTMVVFREAGGRTRAWQDLRQRAERFRALAGSSPAALMILDTEGRCVFGNPGAQAACGCSADECLGEGWSRHVQPQDRDRLLSDWLKALVNKAPFADEFRMVGDEATIRWLRVRSAPMLADDGAVLGHVAALDEVTEHKRTASALVEARREAEGHLQEWAAAEKWGEEALKAARAEADHRLQEHTAARAAAEETVRHLQRQHDERGTALRRAEEMLAAARAEAEERLREETARRQQVEAALVQARQEAAAHAAAHQRAEDALTETQARHANELTEHRTALQATREAHDRLHSTLAEKDGTAESLRRELARLGEEANASREAHNRLQGLLADRDRSTDSHQQELAEARSAREQLQAALAEKEDRERSFRQELEQLRGEAAARQQAEETHAALQSALRNHEQTAADREREKEFIESVLDGSPVGIFAHDRDGRCRIWNTALEHLLGRSRTEALGRTAQELLPALDARDPHTSHAALPAPNGLRTPLGVLGQGALLETVHAPVRDRSGEVIGGVTLVRALPLAVPHDPLPEPIATRVLATAPSANGNAGRVLTGRRTEGDWLGFN